MKELTKGLWALWRLVNMSGKGQLDFVNTLIPILQAKVSGFSPTVHIIGLSSCYYCLSQKQQNAKLVGAASGEQWQRWERLVDNKSHMGITWELTQLVSFIVRAICWQLWPTHFSIFSIFGTVEQQLVESSSICALWPLHKLAQLPMKIQSWKFRI